MIERRNRRCDYYLTMELWTILRCWCIVYVLATTVTIHRKTGSALVVDAAVSRQHSNPRLERTRTLAQMKIRTGKILTGAGGKQISNSNRDEGDLGKIDDDEEQCEQWPTEELGLILGPAYNSRYMSIKAPQERRKSNSNSGSGNSKKRGAEDDDDFLFAVDDTFSHQLSDEPAWTVNHAALQYDEEVEQQTVAAGHERWRRSVDEVEGDPEESSTGEDIVATRELRNIATGTGDKNRRPWECDMRVKWTDLGLDYFPRFLRTVECVKTHCFYGRYTCQPRSFTVKLLRRRRGRCVRNAAEGAGAGQTTRNATRSDQPKYKTGVDGLPVELRELWVWEERAVNFCCDCSADTNRKYW